MSTRENIRLIARSPYLSCCVIQFQGCVFSIKNVFKNFWVELVHLMLHAISTKISCAAPFAQTTVKGYFWRRFHTSTKTLYALIDFSFQFDIINFE